MVQVDPKGFWIQVSYFVMGDNKVPGPANYLDISSLSAVGKYIVSNKKGGTGAKFSKDYRVTEF